MSLTKLSLAGNNLGKSLTFFLQCGYADPYPSFYYSPDLDPESKIIYFYEKFQIPKTSMKDFQSRGESFSPTERKSSSSEHE
jgi:hypothetical protein